MEKKVLRSEIEKLYESSYDLLLYHSWKLYRDFRGVRDPRENAKDLLHEVFASMLEDVTNGILRPGYASKSYVRKIIQNKFWDEGRKKDRRDKHNEEVERIEKMRQVAPSIAVLIERLDKLVRRNVPLTKKEKALWEQISLGKEKAEIAKELDYTSRSVEVLKSRLIKKIQSHISKDVEEIFEV